MGCFWKPAEELLKKDGVTDTVAGYTGNPNAQKAPDYDSVCFGRDWVEGVRVYYDKDKITYPELLDAFFEAQEPKVGSRQYASIIFPHDQDQKKSAEQWLNANAQKIRDDGVTTVQTAVEPLSPFFQAEGYHQWYWEKQRPRFALVIALIALSTGVLNPYIPEDFHSTLKTGANVITLGIAIYQLLERKLDANVVEI